MDSDIGKNMDRISKLPDDLLLHILSLLPTKYAVRTSILSKRWQYLWTFVPIIDIDDWQTFQDIDHLSLDRQNEVDLSFQEFVTNVLFLSKAKKFQKFRLKIYSTEITYNDVDSWISDAIKRKPQNLEFLNMHDTIALPKKLFTSKTLVILRLYGAFLNVPRLVRLQSLKILELHGVEYEKEDSLQKLICGCPILEELDIMRCAWDPSEVVNVSVPTLRRLKVDFDMDSDFDYGYDSGFEPDDRHCKFVVDAPQLEHLDIKNYVAGKHLFRNLSSLSKASLLVQPNRFIDYGPRMYKLLGGIPNVKYLDAFFSFKTDVNHVTLPTFHNLIQLNFGADDACSWEIVTNKSTWNLKLLADLLRCSPKLEALVLKGSRHDESTKSWNPPQQVPICLLSCLKEIQINEFSGKDYELELIEYLLKNSNVLKTMTIDHNNLDDCVIGKLAAFPKGSKACHLNLVCNSSWAQGH